MLSVRPLPMHWDLLPSRPLAHERIHHLLRRPGSGSKDGAPDEPDTHGGRNIFGPGDTVTGPGKDGNPPRSLSR